MSTLARAVVLATTVLRRGWWAAQFLAFALLCQGYGATSCGSGYAPTWADSLALHFLRAVAFPLSRVPSWLYTPSKPLLAWVESFAPQFSEWLAQALILSTNYWLGAFLLLACGDVAQRTMRHSPVPATLPNVR